MSYPPAVGITRTIRWAYADCTVVKNAALDQFTYTAPYLAAPTGPSSSATNYVSENTQAPTGGTPGDPWTYSMFYTGAGESSGDWVRWYWGQTADNRHGSNAYFDGFVDAVPGGADMSFSHFNFVAPAQFPGGGIDHTHISYPPAESRYVIQMHLARMTEANDGSHTVPAVGAYWDLWLVTTPPFDIALAYGGELPLSGPIASRTILSGFGVQ